MYSIFKKLPLTKQTLILAIPPPPRTQSITSAALPCGREGVVTCGEKGRERERVVTWEM